jgi:hypothetical protein
MADPFTDFLHSILGEPMTAQEALGAEVTGFPLNQPPVYNYSLWVDQPIGSRQAASQINRGIAENPNPDILKDAGNLASSLLSAPAEAGGNFALATIQTIAPWAVAFLVIKEVLKG